MTSGLKALVEKVDNTRRINSISAVGWTPKESKRNVRDKNISEISRECFQKAYQ